DHSAIRWLHGNPTAGRLSCWSTDRQQPVGCVKLAKKDRYFTKCVVASADTPFSVVMVCPRSRDRPAWRLRNFRELDTPYNSNTAQIARNSSSDSRITAASASWPVQILKAM